MKSDQLDQAARGRPASLASHGYLLAQRADEPHPACRTERMHPLGLAASRATRTCAGSSCHAAGSALRAEASRPVRRARDPGHLLKVLIAGLFRASLRRGGTQGRPSRWPGVTWRRPAAGTAGQRCSARCPALTGRFPSCRPARQSRPPGGFFGGRSPGGCRWSRRRSRLRERRKLSHSS
jgi:hypothetical protein